MSSTTPAIIRVGNGYDVHRFAPHRPLILGGVRLRDDNGLDGHSDADVVIHAIIDALLGAAALGDIGKSFPDTAEEFRNIDSTILLARTLERLHENGWGIGNVDVTVICEEPKIAPHSAAMCAVLAAVLKITVADISIKGATSERLGFTGRKEGIAALATATIIRL